MRKKVKGPVDGPVDKPVDITNPGDGGRLFPLQRLY